MFVVGKNKSYGTYKDGTLTLCLTEGERYKAKLQITIASGLEVFAYKWYETGTFVEGYIPGPWEDHLDSLYQQKLLPVKGYAEEDSIKKLKNEEKRRFGIWDNRGK